MRIMEEHRGYKGLRVSFAPYMSIIGAGNTKLSTLADELGITKQAASQTLTELEKMGYITRIASKKDGRSKQLQITPSGIKMLDDGLLAYQTVESELKEFTPQAELQSAYTSLRSICTQLNLIPTIGEATHPGVITLGVFVSRVSDFAQQQLMHMAVSKGHSNLKLSYSHVLSLLRPSGIRLQDIVRIRGLSKQAISIIANELSKSGYLERRPDPELPRQQRIHLTEKGYELIGDSVGFVDQLEQTFIDCLGEVRFSELQRSLSSIYVGLKLDQIEFGDLFDPELEKYAKELNDRLGPERARSLGRLLLS